MKFPIMEADAGLPTGGEASTSNESVGSQETLNTGEQTVSDGQPTLDQGQDGQQNGPPEAIPYERFREVNERAKAAELQATMAMRYMQQVMLQNQQQQQAATTQTEQYDPYEEVAKLQEDPRAYFQDFAKRIKQETIQDLQQQQQAEQQHRKAMDGAINKYPELNNDQGKYWVYQNAMSIAQQIQGNPMYSHVTLDQLMEFSAQEIAAFRNGGKTDGLREAQSRNQQKAGAFVEGASNIVPTQADGLQAQLEKAKAAGDANAMINIKLQMMQARQ
jgi:hypothetical protein